MRHKLLSRNDVDAIYICMISFICDHNGNTWLLGIGQAFKPTTSYDLTYYETKAKAKQSFWLGKYKLILFFISNKLRTFGNIIC